MAGKTSRRAFIATGVAAAGVVAGGAALRSNSTSEATEIAEALTLPMETGIAERVLGRTGVRLPVFGLGGAGQTPLDKKGKEREAVELVEAALKLGLRYFDTAANYGESEYHLGKVLPKYRQSLFLSSKTDQRDRDGAWRELERSLKRLNTDRLDLWQMHHVSSEDDLRRIFAADGAIKALDEAKRQKIVRFGGITGHHEPAIILEGLRRYEFDSTLIPINAVDKHHPRPFIPSVLAYAREKQIGVVAMKVPAYGRLFKSGALDGMPQAMGYTLSQPGVTSCIIAAESPAQLAGNVEAARSFVQLKEEQLAALEKRTAGLWEENSFYRAWT